MEDRDPERKRTRCSNNCEDECKLFGKVPPDHGIIVTLCYDVDNNDEHCDKHNNDDEDDGSNKRTIRGMKSGSLQVIPTKDHNLVSLHPNIYVPYSLVRNSHGNKDNDDNNDNYRDGEDEIVKYGGGGSGVTVFGGKHPRLGRLVMKHGGPKDLLELVALLNIERQMERRCFMAQSNEGYKAEKKAEAKLEKTPGNQVQVGAEEEETKRAKVGIETVPKNATTPLSTQDVKSNAAAAYNYLKTTASRTATVISNDARNLTQNLTDNLPNSLTNNATLPKTIFHSQDQSPHQNQKTQSPQQQSKQIQLDSKFHAEKVANAASDMKRRIPSFRMIYISPMHLRNRKTELLHNTFRLSSRPNSHTSAQGPLDISMDSAVKDSLDKCLDASLENNITITKNTLVNETDRQSEVGNVETHEVVESAEAKQTLNHNSSTNSSTNESQILQQKEEERMNTFDKFKLRSLQAWSSHNLDAHDFNGTHETSDIGGTSESSVTSDTATRKLFPIDGGSKMNDSNHESNHDGAVAKHHDQNHLWNISNCATEKSKHEAKHPFSDYVINTPPKSKLNAHNNVGDHMISPNTPPTSRNPKSPVTPVTTPPPSESLRYHSVQHQGRRIHLLQSSNIRATKLEVHSKHVDLCLGGDISFGVDPGAFNNDDCQDDAGYIRNVEDYSTKRPLSTLISMGSMDSTLSTSSNNKISTNNIMPAKLHSTANKPREETEHQTRPQNHQQIQHQDQQQHHRSRESMGDEDGYESLMAFVQQLHRNQQLHDWKVTLAQQTIGQTILRTPANPRDEENVSKPIKPIMVTAKTASQLLVQGELTGSLLHHLINEEICVIRNLQLLTLPEEVNVLGQVKKEYQQLMSLEQHQEGDFTTDKISADRVSSLCNMFVGKAIHKNFHPQNGRFVMLRQFGHDLSQKKIHLKPNEIVPARHLENLFHRNFGRDVEETFGMLSHGRSNRSHHTENEKNEHDIQHNPLYASGISQWQSLLSLAISMEHPTATDRIWTCGLTDGGLHNLFLSEEQLWMFDLGEPSLEPIPAFLTKFLMSFFHALGMEEDEDGGWVVRFVQQSDTRTDSKDNRLRLTERTQQLLPKAMEAFNITVDRLIQELFDGYERVRVLLIRYVITQLISDAAFCIEKWRTKGGGDAMRSSHQYYLEKWLWRALWDVYVSEEIRRRFLTRMLFQRQEERRFCAQDLAA